MAIFTPDFVQFFKELSRNNQRDWFQSNKKRYQQSVKVPFETLVSQLIVSIQEHDPELHLQPKDAILRINRDIRFAADKTPYNTFVTAFISHGGRKDKSIPGFFIRLSPEMVGVMVGCYGPDKHQLENIRTAILEAPDTWAGIVEAPVFREHFQDIRGEQHKRLSSPFKEQLEQYPVLANKQFYALAELSPELLTRDDLTEHLMTYWHAARPLNEFLLKAIKRS
ncbi:DUF2461 domain-containing protein [Flavilitoribacter nigricans]|uniref:TIGR02453 family protein n=1 Tax=Flavilitoribacter nigricans (strain ATCC 23147 / DSM 23189 / NBRC 102662 / NCIMB 1420 / SS-2) TaxID=1122177 RepID=A0A2D0NH07_FLAN2|nr:TIGR02453 family protein [Flavilitoribacter nigricans]PHN07666.1 hypothetical protein CRP01_06085 [Flavilitoribacter nigricans DSM 23189 = NBRC 102662]